MILSWRCLIIVLEVEMIVWVCVSLFLVVLVWVFEVVSVVCNLVILEVVFDMDEIYYVVVGLFM